MTAIASHGKSTSLPFQWQAYIQLKESQRRIKKGSDFGSGGPDDYLIVTPWIIVRFSLHYESTGVFYPDTIVPFSTTPLISEDASRHSKALFLM